MLAEAILIPKAAIMVYQRFPLWTNANKCDKIILQAQILLDPFPNLDTHRAAPFVRGRLLSPAQSTARFGGLALPLSTLGAVFLGLGHNVTKKTISSSDVQIPSFWSSRICKQEVSRWHFHQDTEDLFGIHQPLPWFPRLVGYGSV
ncbi:hypothetical protein Anapl_02288 [Anas platyrhynchos]|uniref:Uncharacterized protein n=1 Tax=Anas platyrhynchos TaxID=8839 RepID=R0M3W4_ANAPL|nr:hypothetical protein Anapl_02288 [Anas platyrhynchos]